MSEVEAMDKEGGQSGGRLLRAGEGETLGSPEAVRDQFLIEGNSFSLLQHLMPGRALAAPLHWHSQEDEYSFVLEGRVGAMLGDEEVFAEAGDFVFKPRGQWHTFWNAGDGPARILEIISPGVFEQAFREMYALGEELAPEKMAEIAAGYGCEVDFEGTPAVIERHGLNF
jgi:mannose-6-phosphate isomerase-like protein (cupin superfamily)